MILLRQPGASLKKLLHETIRPGDSAAVDSTRDSGPDGDPHPGMVLADVAVSRSVPAIPKETPGVDAKPTVKVVDVDHIERQPPVFTVVFTEGDHKFYINDHLFSLDDTPMVRAKVQSFQQSRS
jgi:hypothetical protein